MNIKLKPGQILESIDGIQYEIQEGDILQGKATLNESYNIPVNKLVIDNLPKDAQYFILNELDYFESNFQEVSGYIKKELVIDLGGYWTSYDDSKNEKFYVTSYYINADIEKFNLKEIPKLLKWNKYGK